MKNKSIKEAQRACPGDREPEHALFWCIGNFEEFPMHQKNPPDRIVLRRREIMSLKRPTAGGECFSQRNVCIENKKKPILIGKNKKSVVEQWMIFMEEIKK
jgi:hypothetical protein